MKKLTERIQHIGELVKKTEYIRRGEDVILPDLSTGTQNTGAILSPIPHADSEPKESWLPTSKTNHIPAPNVILRSALFGVVKKGKRQYEKGVLKATFNGYTVKYTGEQLDQSDLDVWLECLQRCQNNPLGNTVRFSSHDFLISISRNTGKSDHD